MITKERKEKLNFKWILLFAMAVIFIFLAVCVNMGIIQKFDDLVFGSIQKIRVDWLTSFFKIITNIGGTLGLVLIMFVTSTVLIILKKRRFGIAICINLVISSLSYYILKNIFQRPRPPIEDRLIEETSFSFPSGHATNNVAFYILAFYLVYKNMKNNVLRKILCILFILIPILICISRVYLGVHYASDVLAGICLGSFCVIIFLSCIYEKIKK